MITQNTFTFLKDLAENNHKEWFDANKVRYEDAKNEMVHFAEQLISQVNQFDVLSNESAKKSIYRIYRDIRFSKDKTPYKTYLSGNLKRATEQRRGGFYFHIEPDNSFVGGGFWGPNSDDLLHLRKQIELDASPLRKVLNNQDFIDTWGNLQGDRVKTAPKGFAKDHEDIDLLRHKSFIVTHPFSNDEVLSPDFVKTVTQCYQQILPFFDVMTQYLTTDLNGESLI